MRKHECLKMIFDQIAKMPFAIMLEQGRKERQLHAEKRSLGPISSIQETLFSGGYGDSTRCDLGECPGRRV
jgi:hypothetical protein